MMMLRNRKWSYLKFIFLLFLFLIALDFYLAKTSFGRQLNDKFIYSILNTLHLGEPYQIRTKFIPDYAEDEVYVRSEDDANSKGVHLENIYLINQYQPKARNQRIQRSQIEPKNSTFVIGESAGFGFPLEHKQTFSTLLEEKLKQKNPKKQVYNASLPGIQSLKALDLAYRITKNFAPERVIVYLGNNLFITWMPPLLKPSPTSEFLLFLVKNSTILKYIFLKSLIYNQKKFSYQPNNSLNQILDFTHPYILYDWPLVQKYFLDEYLKRLQQIINMAKEKNVNLVLMTVPMNIKLEPYSKQAQPVSLKKEQSDKAFDLMKESVYLAQKNEYQKSFEKINLAQDLAIDSSVIHYMKGWLLERLNHIEQSRDNYIQSRDLVVGNLGSISKINNLIKNLSKNQSFSLVDVQEDFINFYKEKNVVYNNFYMLDDCHPSADGHKRISELLFNITESPVKK